MFFSVHNEFTKISLLSETYRIPIENPSETSTYFIGDRHATLETDKPHWRPICLWRPLGDQHACGAKLKFYQIYLNILMFIYFFLVYILCKDINQACWSLVGIRLGMSVSNVSLMWHVCWSLIREGRCYTKHVGLQWFVDQACQSPVVHVGFRWVSNAACQGL